MLSGNKGVIKPYSSQVAFVARCLDSILILVSIPLIGWFHGVPLSSDYWLMGIVASLVHQLLADFTEIYLSWRAESLWAEVKQIGMCWTMVFVLMYIPGSLSPIAGEMFAWPLFFEWFLCTLYLLIAWRMIGRFAVSRLRANGFNSRTAAIVGTGFLAQQVAERLVTATWTGYKILGFFDDLTVDQPLSNTKLRALDDGAIESKTVGSTEEMIAKAVAGEVDTVYIALPMRAEKRIQEILDKLANSAAAVYLVPDLFVFELLHARSVNLNGLPAIGLIGEPMRGLHGWLKRAEDVVFSSIILTLILPLMTVIAVAVMATSRGPAIFKQKRYGMDGKSIEVWKFRTMKVMENGSDFKQATKNDSRITPIGAFLRRTSLDELPQFINVLQGSMSIVGPRPHAVAHNEQFRSQIKGYMRRHTIKPGITGWAQINGWRGETDTLEKMEKRIQYDLDYIHNWSVWWDIKIIFLTVFKGFVGKNAY